MIMFGVFRSSPCSGQRFLPGAAVRLGPDVTKVFYGCDCSRGFTKRRAHVDVQRIERTQNLLWFTKRGGYFHF
jgi:hypothetical protein